MPKKIVRLEYTDEEIEAMLEEGEVPLEMFPEIVEAVREVNSIDVQIAELRELKQIYRDGFMDQLNALHVQKFTYQGKNAVAMGEANSRKTDLKTLEEKYPDIYNEVVTETIVTKIYISKIGD